jgi:hypothetical protein
MKMQVIYNEKTDRFAFTDLTFEEVTNIEYALIHFTEEMEGKPILADLNTIMNKIDTVQSAMI